VQYIENRVVLGCYRVTQGHRQCHHSIERMRYDFHRNCASILYRFRDTASYLSKVVDFNLSHLHDASPGVIPVEFRQNLWRQKTRVGALSYGVVCVILRLAVSTEYRLVTDRQTDTRRQHIPL